MSGCDRSFCVRNSDRNRLYASYAPGETNGITQSTTVLNGCLMTRLPAEGEWCYCRAWADSRCKRVDKFFLPIAGPTMLTEAGEVSGVGVGCGEVVGVGVDCGGVVGVGVD